MAFPGLFVSHSNMVQYSGFNLNTKIQGILDTELISNLYKISKEG